MPDISIRPLSPGELHRVAEIDVSERGTIVYRQIGRTAEPVSETWSRPPKSPATWNHHIAGWRPILAEGGAAIGAFAGARLVGIAVLRPRLSARIAQLDALFVDKDHRRRHVARRLVEEVARLARDRGATALYVSATPSESAIGFYRSQGFTPTNQVNAALYALEPDDIHMIKPL